MLGRACWLVAMVFLFVSTADARVQVLVRPSGTADSERAEQVLDVITASDWSSIGAAYEAGRHAVYSVEEGHRARNACQHWTTHFDGRGFTITPDDGGWSWGLELLSYGFPGAEPILGTYPASTTTPGDTLCDQW